MLNNFAVNQPITAKPNLSFDSFHLCLYKRANCCLWHCLGRLILYILWAFTHYFNIFCQIFVFTKSSSVTTLVSIWIGLESNNSFLITHPKNIFNNKCEMSQHTVCQVSVSTVVYVMYIQYLHAEWA